MYFLRQPYPYYYGHPSLWKSSGIVFLFTFVFYYFFQPFEVNSGEHKFPFAWISLLHALIPPVILLIQGYIYWILLKVEDSWAVYKEFIFFGSFLLFVGLAQFLLRDLIYDNPENWSFKYLQEELLHTFLIGGIFVAIAIPINFNRLYIRNVQKAQTLSIDHPLSISRKLISIKTHVKSESFELDVNEFLFAKSDRNYLKILISTETGIKKELKRMAIKELQQQIEASANIMQTHRSYLINLDKIEEVRGNAQGYTLTFQHCNVYAAVSRNRIQAFELRLQSLANNMLSHHPYKKD